ncbi:PAS domain-containing hybrid sensor histidine kinase/response regulator [Winogradskyella wichelsiae]|uniref:PAS domain-containing hybrid sensor histidine kinase/response regulator n=1 Tax=Winogradskyella wichelsiae TaxID=2697007 RepID=UPI0015CD5B9A|nr:PAS domain-containing hybrid sensor histidine kinase/response regulator [Winogradskyella wichelsiae]
MINSNTHRLLRRQIRKAGFEEADLEKFKDFFEVVNEAYKSFDDDVKHHEIIFEQSSNELYRANLALKSKVNSVETNLNAIVNTIEGVIFKTDMDGNFKYLNKAWEDLIGIPIKDVLGKNYRNLSIGINKKERVKIAQFLRGKDNDYNSLFYFNKSTGEKIWIQLRLVIVCDADGTCNGTIGTMTDVTQLKEIELELSKANKTKDEFVSTMSHEIRTPLNAVIGMSDILLLENYLPEQLENLQILKYSGEHLLELINDLLDLNRFKSDEIKLIEKDFNLPEFIQNIQLHFKQTATKKKLNFDTIIDSNIPLVLKGDSLKLSQVLRNLLSNAFKFTDEGGVVFKVEVVETVSNKTKIRFSIIDTGIGVSYNKQKDIFKSFVQANDNTSALYGGSGLGLYISKELIKIHDSNLHIESEEGKGAKFWFEISYKHSKVKLIDVNNYVSKIEPIDIKVLVAEDNNLNALLLKKLFKKWKVDYAIAKNGQELLDIYINEDFDLILMDLQMPVLGGYETTMRIRKMSDNIKSIIPIVALTAFTESEVRDKTKRYKMNGYLSKPLDVNELYNVLSLYSSEKQ